MILLQPCVHPSYISAMYTAILETDIRCFFCNSQWFSWRDLLQAFIPLPFLVSLVRTCTDISMWADSHVLALQVNWIWIWISWMNYLCQEPLFGPLWSIIKSLTYLSIYVHIGVTWTTLGDNNLKSSVTGETKSKVNHSLGEEGAKYCQEYFCLHFFPQTWNRMLLEELMSDKVHLLWIWQWLLEHFETSLSDLSADFFSWSLPPFQE